MKPAEIHAEIHIEVAPELALFVPHGRRAGVTPLAVDGVSTLGHVVESLGVPLTEVGALVVDGRVVPVSHIPADGESVINQTATAASHGCGAAQASKILNNDETYWPDCNPGFTHANYQMNGKAHADYMDAELVLRIGDLINLARP